MPASYLPYEPDQDFLLPPSLSEWLPQGHLAYFISDSVDALDLSAFHARYGAGGARNQPFHPAMMVKVLLYACASGVFSSRKIAAKLHEDVAFRLLAAGNQPAGRTIRDFRAFHLKEFGDLFVKVVRLAQEMGLVKLGTIAVDGTKVKANASRHKAMSYGHMLKAEAELKTQIAELLQRAHAADQADKNEPELDVPAEIARREDRLQAIQEARARPEQRQREAELQRGRDPEDPPRGGRWKRAFCIPEDKAQENFTDPDSRIMKRAGGGFDASYNTQTAVDEHAHIVVAAELTNVGSDAAELPRLLQAVTANTGRAAQQVLADTGYRSEAVFEQLATGDTDVLVSLGREGKQQVRFYAERKLQHAAMAAKLKTPEGQAAYRKRKWIAEPPNGWIKNVLGFRQFSLRGLHRVTAEWKLVCTALNLRRMCAMQPC